LSTRRRGYSSAAGLLEPAALRDAIGMAADHYRAAHAMAFKLW
jgi:hypothetical protein